MGSTNCLRHHVLFIVAFCVMTSLMGCHNKAQKKNVAAILGYDDNTQIAYSAQRVPGVAEYTVPG